MCTIFGDDFNGKTGMAFRKAEESFRLMCNELEDRLGRKGACAIVDAESCLRDCAGIDL